MFGHRNVTPLTTVRSNPYITFLYYTMKLWGLAPFDLNNNMISLGSWISNVYPIVFVLIFLPAAIGVHQMWTNQNYVGATIWLRNIHGLTSTLCYLAVITTGISIVKNKRIFVELIHLFVKVNGIKITSGLQVDYERKIKILAIMIGFSIIVRIFLNCLLVMSIQKYLQLSWLVTLLLIAYWNFRLVMHLAIISFASVIFLLKANLEKLQLTLMSIFGVGSESIAMNKPRNGTWIHRKSANIQVRDEVLKVGADPECIDDFKLFQMFDRLEKKYRDLHSLIEMSAKLFSPPMVTIISHYCVNLFANFYYTYNVSKGPTTFVQLFSETIGAQYVCLSHLLDLLLIAWVCNAAQTRGNSMAVILHEMWAKCHLNKLRDEIQIFSLQLLQKPLSITIFGFFSLDNSLLYKIFCATVAHLVIMVQLDSSETDYADNEIDQNPWNATVSYWSKNA
ncbi:putative gustatory receptor 28b [Athalia rosae]|uniref:putative gustatory receptor 28b n=1 Tax=Athalia rosae TaxID=37344 RepID=UPI0020342DFE|nr:putative gustatory receptor 28b [Athalia rosae]